MAPLGRGTRTMKQCSFDTRSGDLIEVESCNHTSDHALSVLVSFLSNRLLTLRTSLLVPVSRKYGLR